MAEVVLTNHVQYRLHERGIDSHEVKQIAKNGNVTKREVDGIIREGLSSITGKNLRVISIIRNNKIIIKTAYYI